MNMDTQQLFDVSIFIGNLMVHGALQGRFCCSFLGIIITFFATLLFYCFFCIVSYQSMYGLCLIAWIHTWG